MNLSRLFTWIAGIVLSFAFVDKLDALQIWILKRRPRSFMNRARKPGAAHDFGIEKNMKQSVFAIILLATQFAFSFETSFTQIEGKARTLLDQSYGLALVTPDTCYGLGVLNGQAQALVDTILSNVRRSKLTQVIADEIADKTIQVKVNLNTFDCEQAKNRLPQFQNSLTKTLSKLLVRLHNPWLLFSSMSSKNKPYSSKHSFHSVFKISFTF